ncbi:MAG: hypothetical protein ABI995_04280 [Acidobacteriota bacterium]
MGHIRLGNLPRTRKWVQVVDLLQAGASTERVAAATLEASKRGLEDAARDPALTYSFWLLTQLPLCARADDFVTALNKTGITVTSSPTLLELVGGFTDAIDDHIRKTGGRTDLGEIAQMGATETVTFLLRERTTNLFGTTPDFVRQELAAFATKKEFSSLARDFFSRLTERYLSHFLSQRTSSQFKSIEANREFHEALSLHCRQASKIVESFAGSWYSKTNYEGGITPKKAANFIHVALTKVRKELEKGALDADR